MSLSLNRFLTTDVDSTVLSILQTFLREKLKTTSRANTQHLYESLYPLCKKHHELSNITYDDLLKERIGFRGRYTKGSIKSKIVDWRTFFRWAGKHGYINDNENPAKQLKLPPPDKRNKAADHDNVISVLRYLTNILDGIVMRNVFGQLEPINPRDWKPTHQRAARDIFLLACLYETGARAGEMANLTIKDMTDALKNPRTTGVYVVEMFGKTNEKTRMFTQTTADMWSLWQAVKPTSSNHHAIVSWHNESHVKSVNAEYISHTLVRRCQQAAVEPFRAHSLRHLKAQRAQEVGGLPLAMALLDHNDINSTLFYVQSTDDALERAAIETGLNLDLFSK